MQNKKMKIRHLVILFCINGLMLPVSAQNNILNNVIHLTDSLLANASLVEPTYGVIIKPNPDKYINVQLQSAFRTSDIEKDGLVFKYITDSSSQDYTLSMSVYWDKDELGIYSSPYVCLFLRYKEIGQTPPSGEYPESISILCNILFFIDRNNNISHFMVLFMDE